MQRLVIVYNSRSTRVKEIKKDVLDPARKLAGYMVGRFEVYGRSVDENARKLARILKDGDIVVTAGGDGTTEVGVNSIILSGKDVRLGVLGYGNFNDVARMLGTKSLEKTLKAKTAETYSLECLVDGNHFRYALGYFSAGMFAESTAVFDEHAVREKLIKYKKRLVFSVWTLAKWYFKNRKQEFLPTVMINGRKFEGSDYLAVNGGTLARVMKGGDYYLRKKVFWRATGKNKNFLKLATFMLKSLRKVPGRETKGDVLKFSEPARVVLQSEGEYKLFDKVSQLEFRKVETPIKVFKI